MMRLLKLLFSKRILKIIKGEFFVLVPRTEEQYKEFVDNIFQTYNFENNDSNNHTIASIIMHMEQTEIFVRPGYFARSIIKSMANASAYEALQEIKRKENEKRSMSNNKEVINV